MGSNEGGGRVLKLFIFVCIHFILVEAMQSTTSSRYELLLITFLRAVTIALPLPSSFSLINLQYIQQTVFICLKLFDSFHSHSGVSIESHDRFMNRAFPTSKLGVA